MPATNDWDSGQGKWTSEKVENICSGSMPALEGEYYTPPVCQIKVNRVSKLSAPPNLPIFGDKNQYPVWRDP